MQLRKDKLTNPGFLALVYSGAIVFIANAVFFLAVFLTNASIDHRILFDRASTAAADGAINNQENPPDLAIYSDRFTDCVGLSLNLGGSFDRTPRELLRDMEVPRIEGGGACAALVQMLREKGSVNIADYSRYWHGYQIFSKPFLYLSDLRNLRYIFACLVILAVMVFSLNVSNAFGGTHGAFLGVWFAGGYLLLTDGADLANVFTHSISLFVIFAAPTVAFLALRAGYVRQLFLITVAIGCVNSFFDLLFNPPLGLAALIIAVAAAMSDDDLSVRDIVWLTILVSFGWAIGFFGTYVARFAIAAALSDSPVRTLQEIYAAGMFRVSGIEEKIRPVVFWATIKNFGYPMLRPTFAIFVAITGVVALGLWRSGHYFRLRPSLVVFLVPTAISVIWYEALRNHSQHHHWFTYRSASFSLICLAAFVLFSLTPGRHMPKIEPMPSPAAAE